VEWGSLKLLIYVFKQFSTGAEECTPVAGARGIGSGSSGLAADSGGVTPAGGRRHIRRLETRDDDGHFWKCLNVDSVAAATKEQGMGAKGSLLWTRGGIPTSARRGGQ